MATTPCPHCGADTEPGAHFCGECGERLTPGTAAPAVGTPGEGVALSAAPARPLAEAQSSSGPVDIHNAKTFIEAPDLPAPVAVPRVAAKPAIKPAPKPAAKPAGGAGSLEAALTPPLPEEPTVPRRRGRPTLESLVGRTLNNRYLVERKVGEGGFGAVFQAKQVATGREVALKVLHPHNVSDATVVARFRREAEACSKLTNPHTVTIYDFDETEDGILYLAMELLRGRSLQQVQREDGPLPPMRVLKVLDQVVDALGEAHRLGIVHRDMKPENVMIETRGEEDLVKVLDFGIAKIVEQSGKPVPALTAVGQTLGTLEFMSPEQLRGKSLDGRSDIYALGMMAYEMLTGELPFKDAKSSTEVIQFHLQTPPPAPSSLRPDLKIPEEVDKVVLKMVAKNREDRHADANELRRHIGEVLRAGDRSAVRSEVVRVVAVVGGLALLVTAIVLVASR